MAKDHFKEKASSNLADRLRSTPVNLPMQVVTPVDSGPVNSTPVEPARRPKVKNEEMANLNVEIPKGQLKQLRLKSIETGIPQRQLVSDALTAFLANG